MVLPHWEPGFQRNQAVFMPLGNPQFMRCMNRVLFSIVLVKIDESAL